MEKDLAAVSDLLKRHQLAAAREALSAPSVKLMETVASAIKEDLARVKDVLDIFVRTGMNNSAELVPQLDLLKKISDTLGVLGLGLHGFLGVGNLFKLEARFLKRESNHLPDGLFIFDYQNPLHHCISTSQRGQQTTSMLRLYDSSMARLSVGSGQQQRETAILGRTMARYADSAAASACSALRQSSGPSRSQ